MSEQRDKLEQAGLSCNFNGEVAAEVICKHEPAISYPAAMLIAHWLEAIYWIGHSDGASAANCE